MSKEKKQIDKLTPEQEAKLPEYEKRYLDIGLSTEPCDRQKAEAALAKVYEYQKLPMFKRVIWADSPYEGVRIAASLAEGKPTKELQKVAPDIVGDLPLKELTENEIKKQAETASYGSLDAYWVAFYSFIAYELPVEKDPLVDITNDLIKDCGIYWTFDEIVVCTEKPVAIKLKNKKLHSTDGMAIEYKDGKGLYAVEGEIKKTLMDVVLAGKYEK
jgi:hypothetical protein